MFVNFICVIDTSLLVVLLSCSLVVLNIKSRCVYAEHIIKVVDSHSIDDTFDDRREVAAFVDVAVFVNVFFLKLIYVFEYFIII